MQFLLRAGAEHVEQLLRPKPPPPPQRPPFRYAGSVVEQAVQALQRGDRDTCVRLLMHVPHHDVEAAYGEWLHAHRPPYFSVPAAEARAQDLGLPQLVATARLHVELMLKMRNAVEGLLQHNDTTYKYWLGRLDQTCREHSCTRLNAYDLWLRSQYGRSLSPQQISMLFHHPTFMTDFQLRPTFNNANHT